MYRMRFGSLLIVLAGLVMGLVGCGGDDPADPGEELDVRNILEDVSTGVITATYQELDDAAAAMVTAADAFAAAPDNSKLNAVREAWRTARRPWEQSEGFLFGPVDTDGIDPAIDSWPVNVTDLNAVMASPATLTSSYIDGLEGTLKGFHTIEYLVFGNGVLPEAGDLSAREIEYLLAATRSLRDATHRLVTAWDPSGDDFAGEFASAGESGSRYPSQKAALQDLITGMSTIADEVANGKINDPLAAGDVTLEESRFAANSILDFQDNIRSIQNIYMGRYDGHVGLGVCHFVIPEDADLNDRFVTEVQAAIDAVGAIPAPFTTAIFDHPDDVVAAQTAVRRVQQTLDEDIAPLLDRY